MSAGVVPPLACRRVEAVVLGLAYTELPDRIGEKEDLPTRLSYALSCSRDAAFARGYQGHRIESL